MANTKKTGTNGVNREQIVESATHALRQVTTMRERLDQIYGDVVRLGEGNAAQEAYADASLQARGAADDIETILREVQS